MKHAAPAQRCHFTAVCGPLSALKNEMEMWRWEVGRVEMTGPVQKGRPVHAAPEMQDAEGERMGDLTPRAPEQTPALSRKMPWDFVSLQKRERLQQKPQH